MGKFFLLLLLAIGVVAISRPLRERVKPHVQFALNPAYSWSARNEVNELAQDVETEKTLGHSVPTPQAFPAFVHQQNPSEGGELDPWGNPYYLQATRTTYAVGSNGADGVQGTADDILSKPGSR
ncbi:MAG TPA: type II secretion system protein GspG [Longimicrobiaceae bacterium]|jgi:hypothetical protein|nr:type II secretion system protein GspG [Longimicrobiaceae bacterium]